MGKLKQHSIYSGDYSENVRIVTEGYLTVMIDPINKSSVRITVLERRTGAQIMQEVVGVTHSDSTKESPTG